MLLKYNLHLTFTLTKTKLTMLLIYTNFYMYNLIFFLMTITNVNTYIKKIKYNDFIITIKNNYFELQFSVFFKLFFFLTIKHNCNIFQLQFKNKTHKLSFTKSPFIHKTSYNQYKINEIFSQLHFVSVWNKFLVNFLIKLTKNKLNYLFGAIFSQKLVN